MTDSDKKDELDNYGVWVKKPPRDIPVQDAFDIAADLPDFSSLDDIPDTSPVPESFSTKNDFLPENDQDTSLTSEELSNITGNIDVISTEDVKKQNGSEEKAENNPASTVDDTIPDTFDQETAALTETEAVTIPDASITQRSNELLEEIRRELASLKEEITSLKNDFVELKKSEISPTALSTQSAKEDTGFFNNTEDDDTIALSGDELDNILNNADFTKESSKVENVPAEEEKKSSEEKDPDQLQDKTKKSAVEQDSFYENIQDTDNSLKIDFNNDNLSEPLLDNIDLDSEISRDRENLPEEITVPKPEDILVESSPTDLMDADTETDSSEHKTMEKPEDTQISLETLDDLYPKETPINEALSDEKIDYLTSEEKIEDASAIPEELHEEPAPGEPVDFTEPLEQPAPETFSDNTEPEPVQEEPVEELHEEPAPEESVDFTEPMEQPAATNSTESAGQQGNSLPAGLTQDIKSVLSYMDQLLENLPDDKITEFAQSEQFVVYKKLFTELGLV